MSRPLPIGPNGEIYNPTLKSKPNFNPEEDAKKLRDAMKGLGTDEDAIISILGTLTRSQRQTMEKCYKSLFGQDLKSDLKSELSGNFCDLVLFLMMDYHYSLAKCCYKAISGAGTNESVLIEVLCTATNEDIIKIKDSYLKVLADKGISDTTRNLESDVTNDVGGWLCRVLVALLQGNRREPDHSAMLAAQTKGIDAVASRNTCSAHAESLYDAGEGKLGTDESKFVELLCHCSVFEVALTAKLYEDKYGTPLVAAIKSEMSGDFKTALKTLVLSCSNRSMCFAKCLRNCMKGGGTDDFTLIRIIASRCEIDLKEIMEDFLQLTGESLESWIRADTSGDYMKLLLQLCGIPWK